MWGVGKMAAKRTWHVLQARMLARRKTSRSSLVCDLDDENLRQTGQSGRVKVGFESQNSALRRSLCSLHRNVRNRKFSDRFWALHCLAVFLSYRKARVSSIFQDFACLSSIEVCGVTMNTYIEYKHSTGTLLAYIQYLYQEKLKKIL